MNNDNKRQMVGFWVLHMPKVFLLPYNGSTGGRDCFADHVRAVSRRTNRQTTVATTEKSEEGWKG